jgi:hypothetical protein
MQTVSIDDLLSASRDDLVVLWREVHSTPPPRNLSVPMMRRVLAFDLQAKASGGLSKRFYRTLSKFAKSGAAERSNRYIDGARFIREWHGRTHVVDVIDGRYHWNGKTYRSLSAIAREITGANWSGPRFFGTTDKSAVTP